MSATISLVSKPVPVIEGGTGLTAAFPALTSTWKKKRLAKQFNHSELTLLAKFMKLTLDTMKEMYNEGKQVREELWQKCNPDNPDTRWAFDDLNKIKAELKKLKRDIKTTESILLKIKKQIRSLDY